MKPKFNPKEFVRESELAELLVLRVRFKNFAKEVEFTNPVGASLLDKGTSGRARCFIKASENALKKRDQLECNVFRAE